MNIRTVRAVSALMRTMPAIDAGLAEHAEWLRLKAEIFGQIAAEHRAMAAEAEAYARSAEKKADELAAFVAAGART